MPGGLLRGALGLSYDAAAALARAAAAVAPPGDSKLLRALAARRGIRARYARWAEGGRDQTRPLLWIHAPSVGEGLQARPLLELARRERPDVQLAYTHFSPSALAFAGSLDVDFRDYLPFDTRGDALAALAALQPTALVFSKLDVWPRLVVAASDRGVRLGMVSATLAARSSRRSRVAAALLSHAYARLEFVGAIDETDADRLVALGVRPGAITVTGDTRYDQVWERAAQVDRSGALLRPLAAARPTVVAGSTWPADETPLLAAWVQVRAVLPSARLVIAPHEPTGSHLPPIERWARTAGLRLARLGAPDAPSADVVLVDRTGVLGDLYALADAAFVGGGFHDGGLHSVLEPAAFGVPVLFGPRYTASRDARLLVSGGGGVSAPDPAAIKQQLATWLADAAARADAGARARALVRSGLGAARRSFELVAKLLP
ncbi:MAG: 3-deoxy-D-manno-octulosonic acid transferase [Gemmatimonadaceae bacterium]